MPAIQSKGEIGQAREDNNSDNIHSNVCGPMKLTLCIDMIRSHDNSILW